MNTDHIKEALDTLEEFACIDLYESLITIVQTNDRESLADYEYDIAGDRMDELHTLIKAEQLNTQQLIRIEAVDRFILSNPVPPELNALKTWLKRNALVVKDPDAIPDYPDTSPRPVLLHRDPSRGWYTKKEIEFFQRRNEVYLNLWENAIPQDLFVYNGLDYRSLAPARSALQRVFWGNHLSEGQVFRLLRADLKIYLAPEAAQIAPQYIKLITELLEHFELQNLFFKTPDHAELTLELDEQVIKDCLNRWDWFAATWDDEETRREECEDAVSARWKLHCYYQKDALAPPAVKELIELDKAALLSPNWVLLSSFERLFISKFLAQQGVFDPIAPQANPALTELLNYLNF